MPHSSPASRKRDIVRAFVRGRERKVEKKRQESRVREREKNQRRKREEGDREEVERERERRTDDTNDVTIFITDLPQSEKSPVVLESHRRSQVISTPPLELLLHIVEVTLSLSPVGLVPPRHLEPSCLVLSVLHLHVVPFHHRYITVAIIVGARHHRYFIVIIRLTSYVSAIN
ncbi:unnamed protein product [Microthlaspi erraticum]|uniref:Uncharacterized protein n=1 Tax=Microthlaspi erraticum TaxID=1685480 RepID=A0A6D2LAA4_9BRAS|nr:unnamed protein product [Microthlaspi erraticum]